MKYNKMNRYERKANEKAKREDAMHGEGLFVYENNTKGDLDLPKATASGKKSLKIGEQFQGDNYFMKLVPTMLRYIRCIVPAGQQTPDVEPLKENTMPEKLILDQPDRVTYQGTVENVLVEPKKQPLNESPKAQQPQPDILLTEDPMEGVEIILNG